MTVLVTVLGERAPGPNLRDELSTGTAIAALATGFELSIHPTNETLRKVGVHRLGGLREFRVALQLFSVLLEEFLNFFQRSFGRFRTALIFGTGRTCGSLAQPTMNLVLRHGSILKVPIREGAGSTFPKW